MVVADGRALGSSDQRLSRGAGYSQRAVMHLIRDHDNIAQLLIILESQFASTASGEDTDDELMHDAMEYLTQFVGRFHYAKEDLAIDAAAEKIASVRALQPELVAQHRRIHTKSDSVREALRRALLDQPVQRQEFAAAGFAYTAELRRNIELEESSVFPYLVDALDGEDWTRIEARLERVPDPLFGPVVHGRYAALFQALTRRLEIA